MGQINSDLLSIQTGDSFSFALASSLSPEGDSASDAQKGWRAALGGEQSIARDWDYVMYGKVRSTLPFPFLLSCGSEADEGRGGKVYKFDEDVQDRVTAYASFGGLLMALSGSYRHISGVTVGEYIYLLIRR